MTAPEPPRRAMVLAAGRGERLRPLTDALPKPLIAVRGRALIDRMLDALAAVGVTDAVVNLHHLGDAIATHLAARSAPRVAFSREAALLDTGGGVAKALSSLGPGPFYVANSDVLVLDGVKPALLRLARAWREERMEALLLLQPTVQAFGYSGPGDFMLAPDGVMRRRREREVAAYVFAGLQILHPRLFEGCPPATFSLNLLYDRAERAGRLYGIVHDGAWLHIGAPAALAAAEQYLDELA